MPGNSINPTTIYTQAGGYGNYGAPATQPAQLPPNPYQSGVTSSHVGPDGKLVYDPTNPMQFATPESAQATAGMLGGQAYGSQLTGPGMGWSTPQQMINIPGMQGGVNAGLAANTLGNYGSAPGSYGQFLLARDVAQNSGQQFNDNYNAWATSQPGWKPDPNLANSGPGFNMVPDGKGGFFNSVGMDANQMGANYTQPQPTPPAPGGPPPGAQPGVNGYLVNGQWIPYGQANITPAPPPPNAAPPAYTPPASTEFTPPDGGASSNFPFSSAPPPPEQPQTPIENGQQSMTYPGYNQSGDKPVARQGSQSPYQANNRSYGGYGQQQNRGQQGYQSSGGQGGYGGYGQGTNATAYGSSQYGSSSPYGYGGSYGGGQANYKDQAESSQSSYGGGYNGQQLGQGSYGGYGNPRRSGTKAYGGGTSPSGGNSTF